MSNYEFWDKENGFYGYDEFALKPKPATKKVQKYYKPLSIRDISIRLNVMMESYIQEQKCRILKTFTIY